MALIQQHGQGKDDYVVQGGALVDNLHVKAVDRDDVAFAGDRQPKKIPQQGGDCYGKAPGKREERRHPPGCQ